MLSLSKVIALATLAFGTFTHAAPLAECDVTGIEARIPDASPSTTNPPTLEATLNNLVLQLDTNLAPLHSLEGVTDRVSHVNEVLSGMSVLIKDSTDVVKSLAVKPVDQVLEGTNSVTLTLTDTVSLVSTVVLVVFEGLEEAIGAVNDITQIQQIVTIILQAFVELLQAILDIIQVVYGNQVLIEVDKTLTQSVVSRVLAAVHVQPITLNYSYRHETFWA